MNALNLFKNLIFPHLWATFNIDPAVLGGGLALAGGLAGAFGGGSQGSSSPVNKKLQRSLANPIKDFLGQEAQGFFPGQTFADQSPFTRLGIQGLGNFNANQSSDLLSQTVNGDFLGMNPQVQQSLLDPATQATNAAFSQLGRFGSQANANETQGAGIRALLPLFEAERGRQQQAAQLLPLSQQVGIDSQLQAGQMQDQFNQMGVNEDVNRFNFNPQLNQLNQILPAFGAANNVPIQQQQGSGSAVSGALGGALLGGQLANSFGMFGGGTPQSSAGLLANSGGGNGMDALNLQFSQPFQF